MRPKPTCVGEVDPKQFPPRSVRDEIRQNLLRKLRAGERIFPGIVGFDDSVLPQVINALLAKHDIVFLGLRGQAKTRLCRLIPELLDEETPAIAGSPLREHPFAPITAKTRELVRQAGKDLPIEWIPREARYGEKLATPDVTMADIIGDVDPLKAAHRKLDLSNEEVIHFGVIPRLNRGIFTINELPDLAPRIQVGLLNILEERDVQIRGFPVRFPLDLLLLFTANPEDYTNRGSIITPLKDRIASQILTHYPRTLDDARKISESESWCDRGSDVPRIQLPGFMLDILEEIAFRGRDSEYVDQKSGVSTRLPIAAREILVSQVERRLVQQPNAAPVPRIIDLAQVAPAVTGKLELVFEGEQEGAIKVARHLIGTACRTVFDRHFPDAIREGNGMSIKSSEKGRSGGQQKTDRYKHILDWFAAGHKLEIGDDLSDEAYCELLESIPGLSAVVGEFLRQDSRVLSACAMELVLEGLHQHSLLAKEDLATHTSYSDMLGVMLEDLE